MGRKKGSKNKKTKLKEQKKTIGTDFIGGFLIALAAILFVFFKFDNIGMFGSAINDFSKGLFGTIRFAWPVVLICVGIILIVSEKKKSLSVELAKALAIVMSVSSIVAIFTVSDLNLELSIFKTAYLDSISGENIAGLIGTLTAGVMNKIFGILVSKIILISISACLILYFLHLSIRDVVAFVYNFFATVIEGIMNLIIAVFSTDEEEKKRKEELKEKRRQESLMKEQEKQKKLKGEALATTGSREYMSNITDNGPEEQISMNLDNKEDKQNEKWDAYFKKQREIDTEKNVKEVLQLDHGAHEDENIDDYEFPPVTLLSEVKGVSNNISKKSIDAVADKLESTLQSFGVQAKVTHVTKGPTVVCYELTPAPGVKVSRIVNLADDIALNLAAKSIRIEAPIPGKGTVGIEVPNEIKESVYMREVIDSNEFKNADSKLVFALGKDISGSIKLGDISKMPHVLVAGATGSGKSVCINTILVSILYKAKPSEVKLILIDPKMVEMSAYNGIPHLLIPVVTDPKKAAGALNWAVSEMVDRYTKFASKGVKDIKGYNKAMEAEDGKTLPQIVIVIDELSDLMMAAPNDVEDAICRLAQMARAAGMYLVIATQRPSVDVITGVIKANIPSRIAFTVSSQVDSRTILDMVGAEKLLGRGDMLYYPTGEIKPLRIQGAFVSEGEIESIVKYIKDTSTAKYNEDIIDKIENSGKSEMATEEHEEEADALLDSAIDLVIDMGQASASMLQRRFKIGYSRAGRIVDQMEARGIVSGYEGSKPRQVLISKEEWQQLKFGSPVEVHAPVETVLNKQVDSQQVISTVDNNVVDTPVDANPYISSTMGARTDSAELYDDIQRLQKAVHMDSMFYDDDPNSPNNI